MNQDWSVPDADDQRLEERHFVEDFSLYFEQMGYPRMAGRILGWLLISVTLPCSRPANWRMCWAPARDCSAR